MELYAIDKLMHETRQLAARYRKATGLSLPVTGEIARYDVAKALDLQLMDDLTLGYDALTQHTQTAERILIKGRVIFENSKSTPRIGQVNPDGRWDRVVMVLYDDNYQPVEMYQASLEEIKAALTSSKQSQNKKRGAMSVAQFRIIGHLIWTRENGREEEIWVNPGR